MDRRFKVNDSASGDASANEVKSKEAALEKLRKMEWKRNTQDTWHLARSSSRSTDVQEKKKYNKNEDSYFEGTGVQKTKKLRRPRLSESSPTVPPGFSMTQGSAAPPQVNAWAQKKGSALFQREDEIDEEDQVLKLVLQESLKSAEEDKKRRMERYEMTNLDLPTSTEKKSVEDWQEEDEQEEAYTKPNPIGFQDNSPKADLQFIDTEETPTVNQRCRFIQPKTRKTNPREKSSSFVNNNYDFQETEKKVVSSAVSKSICSKQSIEGSSGIMGKETDNDDFFELSSPQTQTKYSKPIDKGYEAIKSLPSHQNPSSNTPTLHRSSVKHTVTSSEDLSSSPISPLTFGKTQGGIDDEIQENNEYKQAGGNQNSKNETPSYLTEVSNANAQIKPANPCEPSETDIFLHNFIRCEPPSDINSLVQSSVSAVSGVQQSGPDHLFSLPTSHSYPSQDLNSPQFYTAHQIGDTEQHPVMNGLVGGALPAGIHISNGRDSGSSVSGSPLQTMTPYGSLENEGHSNARAAVQGASQIGNVPYPYPYNAETNQESLNRQLQAMQLMNQNLLPVNVGANMINVEYPSVPTPIAGVIPVNPQVGQPQYRFTNSNMIIQPPFPGQTMSPLLMQHQLQQAHMQRMQMTSGYLPHMMGLNAVQLQQSQLGAGVVESEDGSKEQGNINQSQMPNSHQITQNQAQIVTQNQPHVLQLQNHSQILSMQNQAQAIPSVEHTMPKQEELLQQLHKQVGMPRSGGKTKEELQIEYQNAIQALRRVEEKIQEQAAKDVAAAHSQPPWGIISQSPPIGQPLAVNQFFPIHHVHPHLFQQSQNPGLISPTVQHTPQNLTGSMNVSPEMNVNTEINTAQEPAQASPELKIGRGRGRMN